MNTFNPGFQPVHEKTIQMLRVGDRFGFAMTETGEKAYIPSSVINSVETVEGDQWRAYLIPNPKEDAGCPWMATRLQTRVGQNLVRDDGWGPTPANMIGIQPAADWGTGDADGVIEDEEPAAATGDGIDWGARAVVLVLSGRCAYWRTSEICDELLGADRRVNTAEDRAVLTSISTALSAAHRRGDIACAAVKGRADQKASFLLWARRVSDFVEDLE